MKHKSTTWDKIDKLLKFKGKLPAPSVLNLVLYELFVFKNKELSCRPNFDSIERELVFQLHRITINLNNLNNGLVGVFKKRWKKKIEGLIVLLTRFWHELV